MIVRYRCPSCGKVLAQFSVASLDEERFGLDILTPAEKTNIIEMINTDEVEIHTRCEECWTEEMSMPQEETPLLHS